MSSSENDHGGLGAAHRGSLTLYQMQMAINAAAHAFFDTTTSNKQAIKRYLHYVRYLIRHEDNSAKYPRFLMVAGADETDPTSRHAILIVTVRGPKDPTTGAYTSVNIGHHLYFDITGVERVMRLASNEKTSNGTYLLPTVRIASALTEVSQGLHERVYQQTGIAVLTAPLGSLTPVGDGAVGNNHAAAYAGNGFAGVAQGGFGAQVYRFT